MLEVSDLEAARRFYRDMLGFEETLYGEGREGRYWYLVGETARLGLWTPQVGLAGGRGGAHVHFAFHVEDAEIDRLLERIDERRRRGRGPDPARARAARSTSPTRTATWSSSGPRTWPSTRARRAPAAGRGRSRRDDQGRGWLAAGAREDLVEQLAARSASRSSRRAARAISSRHLPSSAIFIATRRAACSSAPLAAAGLRAGPAAARDRRRLGLGLAAGSGSGP